MRSRPRLRTPVVLLAAVLAGAIASARGRESMAPGPPASAPVAVRPEHQVALGRAIFFDATLSTNRNQSCASCHAAEAGWTGPVSAVNAAGAVYQGSVAGERTAWAN